MCYRAGTAIEVFTTNDCRAVAPHRTARTAIYSVPVVTKIEVGFPIPPPRAPKTSRLASADPSSAGKASTVRVPSVGTTTWTMPQIVSRPGDQSEPQTLSSGATVTTADSPASDPVDAMEVKVLNELFSWCDDVAGIPVVPRSFNQSHSDG